MPVLMHFRKSQTLASVAKWGVHRREPQPPQQFTLDYGQCASHTNWECLLTLRTELGTSTSLLEHFHTYHPTPPMALPSADVTGKQRIRQKSQGL